MEQLILNYGKYMGEYDLMFYKKRHLLWFSFWLKDFVIHANQHVVNNYLESFHQKYPHASIIDKTKSGSSSTRTILT